MDLRLSRGLAVACTVVCSACALAGCGARSGLATEGAEGGGPGAACASSPTTPAVLTTLGAFEDFSRATAITASGDTLYLELVNGSNDPIGLDRMPKKGGTPAQILAGDTGCTSSPVGYGDLVTDGTFLYTPDEEMVATCTGEARHVTRIDPVSGVATSLPNPDDGHERAIAVVRVSASNTVYWLAPLSFQDPTYPGTTAIVRWDGESATTVASIDGSAFDLVLAGDQAFVQSDHSLFQVALDGSGPPAVVGSTGTSYRMAGSNGAGDAIFVTPDGDSIVRLDVATDMQETLGSGAGGNFDGDGDSMWADDRWVYFVQKGTDELARVPVTGGAVEVISPDATRDGVTGIVSDACNVYWVTLPSFSDGKPPAVYALAR